LLKMVRFLCLDVFTKLVHNKLNGSNSFGELQHRHKIAMLIVRYPVYVVYPPLSLSSDEIAQVMKGGFMIDNRVLRPAAVGVVKK
jgi:hypothetical protein